jgi:phosphoribosylamine--glycine ligase
MSEKKPQVAILMGSDNDFDIMVEAASAIDGLVVFHAGTALKEGVVVNSGGRVLGVTALGNTVAEAIATAYRGVAAISWPGAQFRRDIGRKALNR